MQIRSAFRRALHDRSGAAMVEFIFAVPILLILFAGIVELGTMMHYYHAVTDGSRAAARYLSRVEDPCDQAELDRAAGLAATRSTDWSGDPLFHDWPTSAAGLGSGFQVTVQECAGGALSGETITFVTSYQYNDAFGALFLFGYTDGFWLNGVHQEVHIGA
ncbi:MAG: pilus assembly protein [Alphaproteobacteria bacterium]|nr:pilus assembly protein [Alphaproteobacteria bacterium]